MLDIYLDRGVISYLFSVTISKELNKNHFKEFRQFPALVKKKKKQSVIDKTILVDFPI